MEYKSLRSPMSREKKIQMQELYDKIRKEQEDSQRVLTYLSSSQLEALKAIV